MASSERRTVLSASHQKDLDEAKTSLRMKDSEYLEKHPEAQKMVEAFVSHLLATKPDDTIAAAVQFFQDTDRVKASVLKQTKLPKGSLRGVEDFLRAALQRPLGMLSFKASGGSASFVCLFWCSPALLFPTLVLRTAGEECTLELAGPSDGLKQNSPYPTLCLTTVEGATAASSVSTPLHSHEATLTITQKTLRHTIQLHPRYLGQNLRDTLETQLRRDVEGTLEADAFVITVMGMNSDSSVQGTVNAQSGFVTFEVTYDAILFRAFKHEVLLGEVSAVTTQGIFVDSGPLSTFIISLNLPEGMEFDAAESCYRNAETQEKIAVGQSVRYRILTADHGTGQGGAIGNMSKPYLGTIDAS